MKTSSTVLLLGICLVVALAITGIFVLAATSLGTYTTIDITIGTVWFFTISFIISLPLLIPRLRKRIEK